MGSGLLYGGIGVLWLVVLGRRWLHRRTLVRADRSAPASSRQRILTPRTDRKARSATVVGATAFAVPAPSTVAAVAHAAIGSVDRSRAVRRRRRILLLLVVLTAAAAGLFVVGRVGWWLPVVAAVVAVGWFVIGASAARAGRRARRGHRRRARNRELARGVPVAASGLLSGPFASVLTSAPAAGAADEPSWSSVPSVEVVARWGRDVCDTDGIDRRELAAASGRDLIQPPRVTSDDPAPLVASWQPVPVPLPTYLSAPRVPRTVARIDLAGAGPWTSVITATEPAGGRGTIQVGRPAPRPEPRAEPRREVKVPIVDVPPVGSDADGGEEPTTEVAYELPRAVGD